MASCVPSPPSEGAPLSCWSAGDAAGSRRVESHSRAAGSGGRLAGWRDRVSFCASITAYLRGRWFVYCASYLFRTYLMTRL
jgi:hypothetical protein